MPVFADVLAAALRHDPGRPLVTFYDHATDERVELSVTTWANWVAKAASLLVDEHDLELGDALRVDLPTHWLSAVFVGAAWTAGLVVGDRESPDVVVCGPGSLERWAPRADDLVVLACSLLPLGVRFRDPLPPGVHDVGVEVWGQPDAFAPVVPPIGDDDAVDPSGGGTPLTHDDLWRSEPAALGERVLTTLSPASPEGVRLLARTLSTGGSLVLVAHPDEARLADVAATERARLL